MRTSINALDKISIEQLRENLKVGQKVKTNQIPWSSGQGKQSHEHRERTGKIIAKYPHYFVVQFPKYKECFRYTDIALGVVQIETEEDAFSWVRNLGR